jgi:uncharacterized membrane protein
MIVGDVYISKIAFNSSSINCDSFADVTNPVSTVVPVTTLVPVIVTTLPAKGGSIQNNTCIKLDNVQLGFTKFRIVLFWITFIALTIVGGYFGVLSIKLGVPGIILIILGIILWTSILVGGIFLSQFIFESSAKNCNGDNNFCYDLNEAQLFFSKITSVLCFPLTIIFLAACAHIFFYAFML